MAFDKEKWREILKKLEEDQETWVKYTPLQIERGEVGIPGKGLRPWSVPSSTGKFLYDLVQKMGAERVLELGTSIGYSTLWMAAALAEKKGKITTIERESKKYMYAKKQANLCGLDATITFHEGEILDFLQNKSLQRNRTTEAITKSVLFDAEKNFDLVFFDAEKGQYHTYFPIILEHLATNGICIFDNIDTHPQKFTKLFEIFKTIPGLTYLHIPHDNGLLLVARNNVYFPSIPFAS